MSLSEIVSVSIQAGTVNPARKGFGIPLLIAYHTAWSGSEVRSYTSFAEVSADFPAAGTYGLMPRLWAAAEFGQNPRPEKIKIGRLPAPGTAHTTVIDATDMASGVAIVGSVVDHAGLTTAINVAWDTNLATTLAALDTALEAIVSLGAGSVTTSSPTCTVVGPSGTKGKMWHFSFTTPGVDVYDTTADWDYDDALDLAVTIDPDFYAIHTDCNSAKNMDKVARWALANQRRAFFAPQFTKPSLFASGLFSAGADYTALLANDSAIMVQTAGTRRNFLDAAWTGDMLPRDPGSATWAFKTLEGVGADVWTSTKRTTIESTNHGNSYTEEAAVAITRPGKTCGGEWIDVVIGLDWLEARLQERLFSLLVNNPKIPYTDAGVTLIVGEIRAQLREAQDRGILASGWTVTAQPVADADSADKAARILRGVSFQATLAGAIHSMTIVGTVTA